MKKIRIGVGAGFSGDRTEPAVLLVEKGQLDFLVLECLAERTIALAQKRKLSDPALGYDPLLERRMAGLLPLLIENNVRLITNMGAANPLAAARKITEMAKALGLSITVAAITGDDVLADLDEGQPGLETGRPIRESGKIISANAYLGAEAILPALQSDAQIIITGRVADPSLVVAPAMHAFGWAPEDFDLLGKATVAGHLMECAGQVTGGYFADGVRKTVPHPEQLGHPFIDISEDGSAVIGKVTGTGGIISLATVKEQLLYEVTDPHNYLTPDVTADFTSVCLLQDGPDQVRVSGGNGRQRPDQLKVSVGYHAGFIGEGEILYAGAFAQERAEMAADILSKRLGDSFSELKTDYIGSTSAHHSRLNPETKPYEIRLRIAGKADSMAIAMRIGEEVEALYTNGPAGGGGVRKYAQEVIGIVSTLMQRDKIKSEVIFQSS